MSVSNDKIIVTALRSFRKRGIRSVKMDDIAHELGISKRTLYEAFRDKETLLEACCRKMSEDRQKFFGKILKQTDNVLELILHDLSYNLKESQGVSVEFIHDLQSYDRIMQAMNGRRETNMQKAVEILSLGVEQGVFRKDVDFKLFYEFTTKQFRFMTQDPECQKLSLADIYKNVIVVYLRGCCTEKGLELIENFKEKL